MYKPEPYAGPEAQGRLVEYLLRELERISVEFDLIQQGRFLPVSYTAPDKPREGQLVIADGTSWNPGSGKGLYEYRSGSWAKL